MTEKLIVLIHSVSRGEAEPTRLRSPAELRQLELRILHAARRREENWCDNRPSGPWRLDAGTHRRLCSRIPFFNPSFFSYKKGFAQRWHGSRNRSQFGNWSFYPRTRTEPVWDQFQMDLNISRNRRDKLLTLLLMTQAPLHNA